MCMWDILKQIVSDIYESGEVIPQMCKSTFSTIPKIPGTLECNKHNYLHYKPGHEDSVKSNLEQGNDNERSRRFGGGKGGWG